MIASDIKDLLSFSTLKSRYDSLSDQYNRILMVRLLLIISVVMMVSWYKDSVNCIVPGGDLNEEFVSAACWIQGMYVYKVGRVFRTGFPDRFCLLIIIHRFISSIFLK